LNPWIIDAKTKRRDKLRIIAEILEIAKNGTFKTQIMYKANLSFAQLNEYIKFMINAELMEQSNQSGREVYAATAKGADFLQRHNELTELLNKNGNGKNGIKVPPQKLFRKN
jgi:predicted transcriptional regulator